MPADRAWPDAAANAAAVSALGGERWAGQAHIALGAAIEASPVVPVPPCPRCDGTGVDEAEVEPDAACVCPSCNGSGSDRLIPESEIRAWIAMRENGVVDYADEAELLGKWLDARRER